MYPKIVRFAPEAHSYIYMHAAEIVIGLRDIAIKDRRLGQPGRKATTQELQECILVTQDMAREENRARREWAQNIVAQWLGKTP